MAKEKLYKVLVNGKSCNGGDYKYDLPKLKDGKWIPGKWTKRIAKSKLSMCEVGYHLTKEPKNWLSAGCSVYLAEAKDISGWSGDKCICSQVRLLEKVETNTGQENTGVYNSGNNNSGHLNSGNRNSGDLNSGYRNSGYRNSGKGNSGSWNSGDRNSGDWNSGDWNSGDNNSGYRNSGNRNSGKGNSGNWNSGDGNSGYLNTTRPLIRIFNKTTRKKNIEFPHYFYFDLCVWVYWDDMTDKEKKDNPKAYTCDGYLKKYEYKEAWVKSFEKANKEDVALTLKLPNFDYNLFEEISGISKKMIDEKLKDK